MLTLGPVPAATAQAPSPQPDPATPAGLVLRDLTGVVGPAVGIDAIAWQAFVGNIGTEPWQRVDVTAELRAPVTTRSALRAALEGADVTPVVRRRSVAVLPRTLAPGGVGIAEGVVPLAGLAPAGEPGGVHPLRLRVVADGREVARLDTAVVRLETPPAATLATTLVWPVTHPALLTTGDAEADAAEIAELAATIAPGGRLRTIVDALLRVDPTVAAGVTLAPTVHLLEDLEALASEDAAALLADLRALAAAGRAGPVATPYADADLARLLGSTGPATGPEAEVAARVAAAAAFEGGRRLLPLLGRGAAPATLVDRTTSRRALDLLEGTVLLPHGALDLPDPALDPTLGEPIRRVTAASGRIVTVAIADPFLADALAEMSRASIAERPGGAVAAAQEVLVRSALLHLTAPGRTDRGLLLVAPTGGDPDPEALTALLARVGTAPWLELVGPATLVARTGSAGVPRAALRDAGAGGAPRLAAVLAGADAALRRTLATVDAPDGPPELAGRTPAALEDALLRAAGVGSVAASAAAAADPATTDPTSAASAASDRALAAATAVRAAAESALGPVAVAAADLTLTDGSGPLPVSVANGGPLPLRVVVEVAGPAGLAWPDGTRREVLLPPGDDVVIELPVAARGTGTFPVVILVRDVTGGELATATIAVRSTAVAGPALTGIGVVVTVMTIVGLVRQRRRGRRRAA